MPVRRWPLRIQLWSYNYDPEPTGIGPVSKVLAESLRDRGHEMEVVAAHPHYPSPLWGRRRFPYREKRDGIPVLRLPLAVGRASSEERIRQELSFTVSQFLAIPALKAADIMVVVSPSFPALLPAMINARARRTPWVLWLHDILPDGAAATGLVKEGAVLSAARQLERTAYCEATAIVVLSTAFKQNLCAKGVPTEKVQVIYDPTTRDAAAELAGSRALGEPRVLSMGNIGYSQGLAPLVRAYEASEEIARAGIKLVITGNGVAAEECRREIRSDRVEMPGLVSEAELEAELRRASLAVVTQVPEGTEFNIPSKLMNFMAYGLPIVAAVNPASEVAHIVRSAQGGWVVDSGRPEEFPSAISEVLGHPEELARRGQAAKRYAERNFTKRVFVERFEAVLAHLFRDRRSRPTRAPAAQAVDQTD